jgi:hypothetical protein
VFKAVVEIPYDLDSQQVLGDGSKGGLNVGAVLMLPDGFKLAPPDRIPEDIKEEVGSTYFMPYAEDKENIIIVGPLPGEQYQEIVFPILSPDPRQDKNVKFGKYAVHVGGNRGRGQVYPTGAKQQQCGGELSCRRHDRCHCRSGCRWLHRHHPARVWRCGGDRRAPWSLSWWCLKVMSWLPVAP